MASCLLSVLGFAVMLAGLHSVPVGSNRVNDTNNDQCAFEQGIEYYGVSFTKMKVDDHTLCCAQCQDNQRCKLWTFITPSATSKPARTCYLFMGTSVLRKVREYKQAISGIRGPQKPVQSRFSFEDGADFSDETSLFESKTESVEKCAEFCAQKLTCKAISFDNKSRTCYGKRGMCCKVQKSGMVSALVEPLTSIDLPNSLRHNLQPVPIS